MISMDWFSRLELIFDKFLAALGKHSPNFIGALVLLLAGWVLARLLRTAGARLLGSVERMLGPEKEGKRLQLSVAAWRPYLDVLLSVLFAAVFLIFLAAATEVVGLPVVSAWLTGLSNYLPRLLAAALILLIGILGGQIASGATAAASRSANIPYGEQIGRLVQIVVVFTSAIVAAGQVGLNITFLTVMAGVAGGSMLGAAALAFGFGAREVVGNILAAHYITRSYRPGQMIRVGEVEGRITEITATAVMVQTDAGRTMVPASRFAREVSVLIKETE